MTEGQGQALPATVVEAQVRIAALGSRFPFPDEVSRCVAQKVVADGSLAAELGALEPDDVAPDGLLDAGSRCMVETYALPALLESVEDSRRRPLTDEQRLCVSRGYLELPQSVLEAAVAEATGDRGAAVEKSERLGEVLRSCGVGAKGEG